MDSSDFARTTSLDLLDVMIQVLLCTIRISHLRRTFENQPRSIVTNFTCKILLQTALENKRHYFWNNSEMLTLTKGPNRFQQGGGFQLQRHTLQD